MSVLVVHHIPFHGLDPLSRQKSASQEDSCNNTLAGFSNPFQTFSASYSIESQGETGWDRIRALTKMLWSMITPNVKKHICTHLRSMEFNTFNVASCRTIFFLICTLKALSEATSFAEQRWTESSLKWYWHQPRLKIDSSLSHHFCPCMLPLTAPNIPKRHHLISTLYRLSHPSRNRTTTQWANVLRNCCKVIDLNNQTGATGSFWEDPLGLGQVSLLMFLLQMPLRMRKASVEKTREKWTRMETMFLRLSSVPWDMGSGPGFPVETTRLCSVVRSWQWDMPIQLKNFELSHGPLGVLKALQLKDKNLAKKLGTASDLNVPPQCGVRLTPRWPA